MKTKHALAAFLVKISTGLWHRWEEERWLTLQEWKRLLYNFARSRLSVLGSGVILLLVVLSIAGGSLAPYPEDATGDTHLDSKLQPPSLPHAFGTDMLGRDVLSRVILATKVALQIGMIVLCIAIGVGCTIGAVAGFTGGLLDNLLMRIADVFMTMPYMVLAIVVAAALGPGIRNAILAMTVIWWAGYSRLMRGEVLRIREETYVLAAKSMGASRAWIIRHHILPNSITPILIRASMDMGTVILTAAGLGFVGLGAQPPQPEWGQMISDGRRVFPTYWWVATFPGLAIFLAVVGFNLFGDGLRDVLEPSSRR